MNKEIKINFSYVEHEYLINFYEDGNLKGWKVVNDSKDITKLISEFYFSNQPIQ